VSQRPRPVATLCLALGIAGSIAAGPRWSPERPPCFRYQPDTISLGGRLVRLTFPGPPHFRSVAAGDSADTGFYLRLEEPVCFESPLPDSAPRRSVGDTLVRLEIDPAEFNYLWDLRGKVLLVRGRAHPAESGQQHTAVVLRVDSAVPALEN